MGTKKPAKPAKKKAAKRRTTTKAKRKRVDVVERADVTQAMPVEQSVEHVYVLKTVIANMTAHNGFRWPESGPVEAPDWRPTKECGNGLHGWLWGAGSIRASNGAHECADSKWLVLRVVKSEIVDLDGKVKFPRCEVVFCGTRDEATKRIVELGATGPVIYGTATAGYRGTATAGDGGTATAGEDGEIRIRFWDPKSQRYRVAVGYVGEGGIEPKTAYVVRDGKLAKK